MSTAQITRKENMRIVSQILRNIYAYEHYTLKGAKQAAQPWIDYLDEENKTPLFSKEKQKEVSN